MFFGCFEIGQKTLPDEESRTWQRWTQLAHKVIHRKSAQVGKLFLNHQLGSVR
jgi:hypothetical protein